jgi:SAM-dependent methyltransferase
MAAKRAPDRGIRHSAVYSYLRPILVGRRVLEIRCGTGESAAHLGRLGARSVVGADDSGTVAEARSLQRQGGLSFVTLTAAALEQAGPFDVVLLPEAADVLLGRAPVSLPAVLKLVAPGGRLVCVVPNGDQKEAGGLSYYDLVDRLSPHFPKVRMFGQTRFAAWGIAEFDEAAAELRVDSELTQTESEEPSHYLALCGQDEPLSLGYALVQIPSNAGVSGEDAEVPAAPAKADDASIIELRQRLAEFQGQNEGLIRVSRAQSEEIEELRGRVRRTAEAKAELDVEVQRLRRALVEADESVVNLTRKTADEMTALAHRLTSGLRPGEAQPSAEELKRREAELAERESALSERDDRIASLEAARQETLWRADAAEDELGRLRADVARLRQIQSLGPSIEELQTSLRTRDQALDEFQKAAAAHLDEMGRLRDALNEQSSLVAELEEDLATAEKRLNEALEESTQLRRSLTEVEDADRQRRSRLAELEGVMLRMGHGQAQAQSLDQQQKQHIADLEVRLNEAERRLSESLQLRDYTERARKQAETHAEELEQQLQSCGTRVRELESQIATTENAARSGQNASLEQTAANLRELEARLKQAEAGAERADQLEALLRVADAKMTRLAELEAQSRLADEATTRLAELRAEAPDPEEVYERLAFLEAQNDAVVLAAARVPSLESKLATANALIAELQARLDRNS